MANIENPLNCVVAVNNIGTAEPPLNLGFVNGVWLDTPLEYFTLYVPGRL